MGCPTDCDRVTDANLVGDENNRLGSRPTKATSAAIRNKGLFALGGILAGSLADLCGADECLFCTHGFHCAAVICAISCHGWPVEITRKPNGPAGAAIVGQ